MSEDPQRDDTPRNAMALTATLLYGLFVCLAVLWFWLRDRQERLAELAVGDSVVASMAAGAGVGLVVALAFATAVRYIGPVRRLEHRLRGFVGVLSEAEILVIAMASAIGEEMLFRGALQDQLGDLWYLTPLAYALLHVGPGLLLWSVFAAILGLAFSAMVHAGFGLLSVTVAHALINFFSLRRMALYRPEA